MHDGGRGDGCIEVAVHTGFRKSVRTDLAGGKDPVYDHSGETRSAPVTVEGRRLAFKAVFEPVTFVFEGNRLTATRDGRVDIWEKVD